MKIERLSILTEDTLDELLTLWEKSVRSTHHFLTDGDIDYFRPLVRNQFLPAVELFIIRNACGHIAAFMGISDDMLEMLFVLPREQGRGYGKALVNYAVRECGILKVDVNEDNRQAFMFYKHMGYEVIGRDESDSTGKPFPILHLQLT